MSAYVYTTKLLALFNVIQRYKTNHFREVWHVGNYLFQPMYKCTANVRCLDLLCLGTELRDFNSRLTLFIEVLDFSLYFVKKIQPEIETNLFSLHIAEFSLLDFFEITGQYFTQPFLH